MSANPIREPAVAGQFYPGTRAELRAEIEACYLDARGPGALPEVAEDGPREVLGLVSPHAGYFYSGAPAAMGYARLAQDGRPATVVIVGPSHQLGGFVVGLQSAGAWRTPLGDAQIDEATALALAAALPGAVDDARAFTYEHSLEVQVPFLQHLYGERLRIVPVIMAEQSDSVAQALGTALGVALAGRDAVIVASTDMTHMQPAAVAREQDLHLASYIERRDPAGLLRERRRGDVTMCGYGPVAAMLLATEALGAHRAEVLAYRQSGDVAAMPDVVGYLSAVVLK
ncbi:MAG TPA: AmmeMemoRadiSam system protein B [Armatimonadota bacterium]|jgi:hypothetical protein